MLCVQVNQTPQKPVRFCRPVPPIPICGIWSARPYSPCHHTLCVQPGGDISNAARLMAEISSHSWPCPLDHPALEYAFRHTCWNPPAGCRRPHTIPCRPS
ncbi:hypothetical protein CENSYa_0517 [Cenarchaeum symbiosum A]|uniref:Uncharacterized protein n=1 Tax=Cenarchaeum symbiosum (strain A) TaxID=414004 RepID=A0RUY3_CENSY|nr:hypothetical protein CENSYa_0517 [Cenarchaeum symbiosum A]